MVSRYGTNYEYESVTVKHKFCMKLLKDAFLSAAVQLVNTMLKKARMKKVLLWSEFSSLMEYGSLHKKPIKQSYNCSKGSLTWL